jgi:hypothetical protein
MQSPEGPPFPTAFKMTTFLMDDVTLWAKLPFRNQAGAISYTIQGVRKLNSFATRRSAQ